MPSNPGRNPFEGSDSPPLCDIRFRNGLVVRCIDPRKYRWKQWPTGPHAFDVVSWQLSTGKDYEMVWPDSDRSRNGGDAASGSVNESAGRRHRHNSIATQR